MTSIRENHICMRCAHNDPIEFGCKAFPDGIPDEILISGKHFKPVLGQINNLVFQEEKDDYSV